MTEFQELANGELKVIRIAFLVRVTSTVGEITTSVTRRDERDLIN